MSKCAVPGCNSQKNEKLTFFNIPLNPIMRNAWEKRIGVEKLMKTDVLCAKHFKLKDVLSSKCGGQKLRISAIPQLENDAVYVPSPPPPISSKKKLKNVLPMITPKSELPEEEYLAQTPLLVNHPTLQPQTGKRKTKSKPPKQILDPLDIKNEIMETDDIRPSSIPTSFNSCVSFVDSASLSRGVDVKPMDRLAQLESENAQLKTKYSQLINDYVQMKTEKIQLKAELDAALTANQKLIIVKNSLVTTIQTMGKMSDAPSKVTELQRVIQSQLKALSCVTDTIVGV